MLWICERVVAYRLLSSIHDLISLHFITSSCLSTHMIDSSCHLLAFAYFFSSRAAPSLAENFYGAIAATLLAPFLSFYLSLFAYVNFSFLLNLRYMMYAAKLFILR